MSVTRSSLTISCQSAGGGGGMSSSADWSAGAASPAIGGSWGAGGGGGASAPGAPGAARVAMMGRRLLPMALMAYRHSIRRAPATVRGMGIGIAPCLQAVTDILARRVEERCEGAAYVAQADARADVDDDRVCANRLWRIADAADARAAIMRAQKADHVVLVDAVARHADSTDKAVAAIDGDRSRKDLDAVLQPVLPRHDIGQRRAALRRVGRAGARDKAKVRAEIADDQRRLQPGREGIELRDRARQRALRAANLAIGEVGPRQIAPRAVGKGDRAGQRRGVVEEGPHGGYELAHVGAGIGAEFASRLRPREKSRGARFLQADVGAKDRRIGRADDAEHRYMRVDDADRHLRPAVERAANLRARTAHHREGFFQNGARFGLR